MTYRAPLRDMRFMLWDVLGTDEHLQQLTAAGAEGCSRDVLDAVLDEAGRFSGDVLAPLNAVGDRDGCLFDNGVVRAPDGFKSAFEQYAAGGWSGINGPVEYGG